jgi:hypothetical protein
MDKQTCVRCEKTKGKKSFPKRGPAEKYGMCLKCRRQDRDRIVKKNKRQRNRDKVLEIKRDGSCAHCKIQNHVVLQFHHHGDGRANKSSSVSKLLADSKSWDVIQAEIDKCIILCANCHVIEHEKEFEKSRHWPEKTVSREKKRK